MRQHDPEHLLAEGDPGQRLVERALCQRVLRDRGQAAGGAGDDAHRRRQLRLGPQQLLGVDQREQLRRLVPAGLRHVALHLSDHGLQCAHVPSVPYARPAPLAARGRLPRTVAGLAHDETWGPTPGRERVSRVAFRTSRAGLPTRPRLLTPALVGVALLLVLLGVGVSLYTDLLWFRNVGFTTVFTNVLVTRLGLFVGFGLLMAVLVGANLVVAYRVRPPFRPMSLEQQNLERYRMSVEPYLLPLLLLASAVVGLFAGLSAAGRWQTWLLWRNRTDFGVLDPQFGRDVSYYAMTYPFQRFVLGFLFTAVVLSFLAAAAVHYLFGGLRLQTAGEKVSPAARAHLSVLVGVFVLLKAVGYYLDRFGLAFSLRGVVQGASYTDVNAVLPAKNILIGVAVICALLFFANIIVRNILLPAGALGLLVLAAVVLGGLFPAYTQQFRVKPNEVNREAAYIARNIEATRAAYGIKDTVVTQYEAAQATSPGALQADTGTLPNARLLDPGVLQPTFEQLQRFRSYFGVGPRLDIDRYMIDGRYQDVIVAAREVDQSGLQPNQRNWINERLTYTHGNGIIAAPANQVDSEGKPIFVVGNVPPSGPDGAPLPFPIDQPRIYYGELSPSYSVVRTKQGEIDGPAVGEQQVTFTYDGTGGVQLSNSIRKIAYALKFREPNLLLSGDVTNESRLMYVRSPRERVEKVAPFLQLDSDPYPAVVDGRVLWIVDGYTTSNGYPYAEQRDFGDVTQDSSGISVQPRTAVNYIRNSVKATVDAYTGEVTLYRFGQRDAVLETWAKAFPGIIKPASDISPELRSHFRYPEDLFKVQRDLLSQYHVTNPGAFYNKEDFWRVPVDPAEGANRTAGSASAQQAPAVPAQVAPGDQGTADQPPYYSLLQFPGQPNVRFGLSTSFVGSNGANLSAFASVSSDEQDYGTIRVLRLPRGVTIDGPGQVVNQFLSNRQVADSLFALQRNGKVTFGNLLTLPVADGLLYVQPVFVQASAGANAFPTLQQVIVSFGSQTVSRPTLGGALTALYALLGSATPGGGGGSAPPTPPPTAAPSPGPTVAPPADVAAAIAAADRAFRDGQAAFGRGDFVAYGEAQQRLQQALQQLTRLGAAAPSASPSP